MTEHNHRFIDKLRQNIKYIELVDIVKLSKVIAKFEEQSGIEVLSILEHIAINLVNNKAWACYPEGSDDIFRLNNKYYLKYLGASIFDEEWKDDILACPKSIYLKVDDLRGIIGDDIFRYLNECEIIHVKETDFELAQKERIEFEKYIEKQKLDQATQPPTVGNSKNYNPTERETHLQIIYGLVEKLTKKDINYSKYQRGNNINKSAIARDLADEVQGLFINPRDTEGFRNRLTKILKEAEPLPQFV
ncbi:hypothetical protein GRR95_07340 [Glaesserella parasuis]|nr:hypothetical protein [Glaesserella parasuis]MWP79828.1 hypothetical protein [Glaesserella parasuis]